MMDAHIPSFHKAYPHEVRVGDLVIAGQHIAPVTRVWYEDAIDMWYIVTHLGQRMIGGNYRINVYDYIL